MLSARADEDDALRVRAMILKGLEEGEESRVSMRARPCFPVAPVTSRVFVAAIVVDTFARLRITGGSVMLESQVWSFEGRLSFIMYLVTQDYSPHVNILVSTSSRPQWPPIRRLVIDFTALIKLLAIANP